MVVGVGVVGVHPDAGRSRPGRRLDDLPVRVETAEETGEQPTRLDPQQGGELPLEGHLAALSALDPLVERPAGRVVGDELAEPAARQSEALAVVGDEAKKSVVRTPPTSSSSPR